MQSTNSKKKQIKPFTDIQRADFIVEYNHQQGLNIQETDTALYALEADSDTDSDVDTDIDLDSNTDYEESEVTE